MCGATYTVVVDCCGFSSNGEWRVVNNTSVYTSLSRQHADARPNGQTARYVSGCLKSGGLSTINCLQVGWGFSMVCQSCVQMLSSPHGILP